MPKPTIIDESELLRRLHNGDYDAFEQIYDRYKNRLAANLMKLLKSPELVNETLQDLFMRLWESRSRIDPNQPIKGYLFRIAENLVFDLFRKAARDVKMRNHFMTYSLEAYDHIEKALFEQEHRDILHQAIDQLPPQRRNVYKLCKLEEKSYREVSELLGISQAAVNDHISKANAFLKTYFSNHPAIATLLITSSLLYSI